MDQQLISCASFAGGFVPIDTEVVVIVTDIDDKEIAMVKTKAQAAPSSPREAIYQVAEAYDKDMGDIRATVFVVIGGADGKDV